MNAKMFKTETELMSQLLSLQDELEKSRHELEGMDLNLAQMKAVQYQLSLCF